MIIPYRSLILCSLIVFIFSIPFYKYASANEKGKNNMIKLHLVWKVKRPDYVATKNEDYIWGDILKLGGGIEYARTLCPFIKTSISFDYIYNYDNNPNIVRVTGFYFRHLYKITYRIKRSVLALQFIKNIKKIQLEIGCGFGMAKANWSSWKIEIRTIDNRSGKVIDVIKTKEFAIFGNETSIINNINLGVQIPLSLSIFDFAFITTERMQRVKNLDHHFKPFLLSDDTTVSSERKHIDINLISGFYIKAGLGIYF